MRAGIRAGILVGALAGLGAASAGCGGSPTAPARDDVFYLHSAGGILDRNASWEVYFKPLDQPATPRVPRMVGVGVLNGDVRLARPLDWMVRAADYTSERRFISYQSPRQFLFSIYERVDGVEDPWPDVLQRYEADVDEQGSTLLSSRIPVATANTQGRSYLLKTRVPARPDYQSYAHEVILRGDHRLLLVQVVHGESIEAIADEVSAAFQTITVY